MAGGAWQSQPWQTNKWHHLALLNAETKKWKWVSAIVSQIRISGNIFETKLWLTRLEERERERERGLVSTEMCFMVGTTQIYFSQHSITPPYFTISVLTISRIFYPDVKLDAHSVLKQCTKPAQWQGSSNGKAKTILFIPKAKHF